MRGYGSVNIVIVLEWSRIFLPLTYDTKSADGTLVNMQNYERNVLRSIHISSELLLRRLTTCSEPVSIVD